MKKRKRILCLLLAGLCLLGCLSGCGGDGVTELPDPTDSSDAMGRYVETSVKLPSCRYMEDMVMLNDGRLRIAYIKEDGTAAVSTTRTDRTAWAVTQDLPEKVLDSGAVSKISLSPDGRVFCCTSSQENTAHFWLMEANGACRELPVAVPDVNLDDSQGFLQIDSDFSASGALYVQFQDQQVRKVDLQTGALGENLNELESSVARIGCGGETVFIIGKDSISAHEDGVTAALDNAMGQQLREAMAASDIGLYQIAFWQDRDGYLFFITEGGLFSYIPGGSITEELVSGARSTLSDPGFTVTALTGTEEDSFYVLGYHPDSNGPVLLHYAYDANTPTVSSQRLNIYSLYENDDLRQLVSRYRVAHPELEISLEIGLEGGGGITEADAIRTLNTQILAGSGPDVLMLDGFNLDSYLEKGVLADLSGVLDRAEPTLPQVTRCYEREGKVCAVPTRFILSAMYGPGHIVSQIHDLDSLVAACQQLRQEHPEAAGALGALNPECTAEWFYDSCCYSWMNDDGTIDEEQLTAFYAAMQTLYAMDASFREKYPNYVTRNNPWDVGEVSSTAIEDSAFLYQSGALISFGTLNGMHLFSYLLAADDKFEGYETERLELSGSGLFIPQQIMGILTDCAHPQAAEEFLIYLLSAKAQEKDWNNTFPVNLEIHEKELALESRSFDSEFRYDIDGGDGGPGTEFFKPIYPDAQDREKLRTWIENLHTPTSTDRTIRRTIQDQIPPCLFGEITPEEAAQTALETLNLYLAE